MAPPLLSVAEELHLGNLSQWQVQYFHPSQIFGSVFKSHYLNNRDQDTMLAKAKNPIDVDDLPLNNTQKLPSLPSALLASRQACN